MASSARIRSRLVYLFRLPVFALLRGASSNKRRAQIAAFLHPAVALDVVSQRIVGWSLADILPAELMLAALVLALLQRRPCHVIHHYDQGCQYTLLAFVQRCSKMSVRLSMGTVGDCFERHVRKFHRHAGM